MISQADWNKLLPMVTGNWPRDVLAKVKSKGGYVCTICDAATRDLCICDGPPQDYGMLIAITLMKYPVSGKRGIG